MKNKPRCPALTAIRPLTAIVILMLLSAAAYSVPAQGNSLSALSSDDNRSVVLQDSVRLPATGDAAARIEEQDTTEYESTSSTPYEKAALVGANAILIPLAITVATISIAPPNFGMVIDNGVSYAAVGFETGVGLGPKLETGRFADRRIMFNYTHIYNNHRHDIWRVEGVKDFNFGFIDQRNIFAFGVSPMAGLFVNGSDKGYSLGTSVRLMLPSLPYIGMFPLHTIGVTYRYNRTFNRKDFHTAGFGISAAVIF